MVTRRRVLQGLVAFAGGAGGFGGYALAEPWGLAVTRYAIMPPDWPAGLSLRVAVLADLHICEPWMSLARVQGIVEHTNAMRPDAVLLLGDYRAGHGLRRFSNLVPDAHWAGALARLQAPLGVHAVLGNHDWWDDVHVQERRRGPTTAGQALQAAGIPVYENTAVRLANHGHPFWIAGLGDQWAFYGRDMAMRRGVRRFGYAGVDDLGATLAAITDDAPVILMAHEPDIFPTVPARVAVTVSGHTHGGQVRMFGYAPFIPSAYGRRFAYGHIIEDGRHLVVSGGLGCSGAPVRFAMPPEIVMLEIGRASV